MENTDEALRLDVKTDPEAVKRQAAWAGIGTGMRVLDVACGSGAATSALLNLVGENGHVTGLDFSEERLEIARNRCSGRNASFFCHDIRTPFLTDQPYDAVWMRFILEYFREEQRQIVANCVFSLRSGGIACLADSDGNSLNHYGLNDRVQRTIDDIFARLTHDCNFDPYAGRRLYGHLYHLGFANLNVMVEAHHLFFGELAEKDAYNWQRKISQTAQRSGCRFEEYDGNGQAFIEEAMEFMRDPGRFTYTPLIVARGVKPG